MGFVPFTRESHLFLQKAMGPGTRLEEIRGFCVPLKGVKPEFWVSLGVCVTLSFFFGGGSSVFPGVFPPWVRKMFLPGPGESTPSGAWPTPRAAPPRSRRATRAGGTRTSPWWATTRRRCRRGAESKIREKNMEPQREQCFLSALQRQDYIPGSFPPKNQEEEKMCKIINREFPVGWCLKGKHGF